MKLAQELIIKVYKPLLRKQRCLYIFYFILLEPVLKNNCFH